MREKMQRENREFLMLASDFDPAKHRMGGMWLSEKMDGQRCIWLPATQGLMASELPFANHDKKKKDMRSTGLWTRYGNPIMCPVWFTTGWPDYPLDGELWAGRGKFQLVESTVRKHEPNDFEWAKIKFHVFEQPQYEVIFRDGRINGKQYTKAMKCRPNMEKLGVAETPRTGYLNTFDTVFRLLQRDLAVTNTLCIHEQRQLPFSTEQARTIIYEELERITDAGGEGLILRHPGSEYETIRSKFLLKLKKLYDAEAMVVGYRAGQGKYLGMLGSLTVSWQHGQFELSGFTDDERRLTAAGMDYAHMRPGELFPVADIPDFYSLVFPLRSAVTFRYRELSEDQVPKEGRFLRKYEAT